MAKCVSAFVVGHFSVSKRMQKCHSNIEACDSYDNLVQTTYTPPMKDQAGQELGNAEHSQEVYTWVAERFSNPGDTVMHLCCETGHSLVACLKNGQNAFAVVDLASVADVMRQYVTSQLN